MGRGASVIIWFTRLWDSLGKLTLSHPWKCGIKGLKCAQKRPTCRSIWNFAITLINSDCLRF